MAGPRSTPNGRLIPRFVPGTSRLQTWMPLRGSSIDVTPRRSIVNDRWTAGSRAVVRSRACATSTSRSKATGDISGADGDTLVPRLGAAYALTADGRTVAAGDLRPLLRANTTTCSSRATRTSATPTAITGRYIGPAGEGRDFAAGFDPANYQTFTGTFPTANVFFADDLKSPLTRELTLALARDFGRAAGRARPTCTRHATNFVEDFITIADGQTVVSRNGVNLGAFDNAVYRNSDRAEARLPGDSQFAVGLSSAAPASHSTGSGRSSSSNNGNFEGEAPNNPALPSLIGDYPEIYRRVAQFSRWTPRRLPAQQGPRLGDLQLGLGRFGRSRRGAAVSLQLGPHLQPHRAGVALSAQQIARNPGYARLPASQSLFFGERGSQSFAGYHLVDLAATYSVPVWESLGRG